MKKFMVTQVESSNKPTFFMQSNKTTSKSDIKTTKEQVCTSSTMTKSILKKKINISSADSNKKPLLNLKNLNSVCNVVRKTTASVYPTLNNSNLHDKQSKVEESTPKVDISLKIFTTTCSLLVQYTELLNKNQQNNHLFIIRATLDSVATGNVKSGIRFTIADIETRIYCVFYEMDRQLPKLNRTQEIRCVGKYDLRKRVFVCVSVRHLNRHESEDSDKQAIHDIHETDKYMKLYYV
jgi:ribonucleotide monophosphatase NagD (HAD superfamily)